MFIELQHLFLYRNVGPGVTEATSQATCGTQSTQTTGTSACVISGTASLEIKFARQTVHTATSVKFATIRERHFFLSDLTNRMKDIL